MVLKGYRIAWAIHVPRMWESDPSLTLAIMAAPKSSTKTARTINSRQFEGVLSSSVPSTCVSDAHVFAGGTCGGFGPNRPFASHCYHAWTAPVALRLWGPTPGSSL